MRKRELYKVLQYLQSAPRDLGWPEAVASLEYLLNLED